MESLVAEHLDHLHYIHDILCLDVSSLNDILVDHLLNRLFIPLYVNSMCKDTGQLEDDSPRINSKISLFLLSQVRYKLKYSTCTYLFLSAVPYYSCLFFHNFNRYS